jgi:hypothetical protein
MADSFACPTKNLSLEQLPGARRSTQAIAAFLEKQLFGYLDALQSLLLPDRLLGKLTGARFEAPGTDKVLSELQENYRRLTGKPFDFPKELEVGWLSEIGTRLDLNRWEYNREIEIESGKRSILITSPARWTLSYGPGYTVSQASQAFANKQDRRGIDQLRQFVVNALVINALITKSAGLTAILGDLRYDVTTIPYSGLNGLSLVVIQSQIPTYLPPEPLIASATELSGVAAFIELIDVEAVYQMLDPLKQRVFQFVPHS